MFKTKTKTYASWVYINWSIVYIVQVWLENILLLWPQDHASVLDLRYSTLCNNVALPYLTLWYLPGRGTLLCGKNIFDALPCFSHDIHATLSTNCKYISFNPNVPCLNVILTSSMQNITFCSTARLWLDVLLITQRKVFVKHTTIIDKCKYKRKIMLNYQCCWVKKMLKHVKTILK